MRTWHLLLALLCCGCSPTEMESGQAVLLAAPIITLVGAAIAFGFAKLWAPLVDGVHFRFRPTMILLCVQSLLCVGIVFFPPGSGEWVGQALIIVGASYLTIQLISLRIALWPSWRRHYSLVSFAPWYGFYPPALLAAYFGSPDIVLSEAFAWLYFLPGFGGVTLLPIALALVLEVLVRRKRHAARRRERLPKPLPEARARYRD